ncbi:hypothetical protein HPB48_019705 [Haemaphysalis longicornis]|uniref:GH18 domain-containing protein n=1 Tax=Haemaphysalis longicornis TaxID=44386 RepID=A0A9J6G4Q5_HAELO|nr:hypothetical protein HPB48_019705 [Haemaphysalis longicornis]
MPAIDETRSSHDPGARKATRAASGDLGPARTAAATSGALPPGAHSGNNPRSPETPSAPPPPQQPSGSRSTSARSTARATTAALTSTWCRTMQPPGQYTWLGHLARRPAGHPSRATFPWRPCRPWRCPPLAEEPRALGADVLISVACLLSVLVCLLALAIALEALLLRMLNLDGSTSTAEAGTPERQPRLQRHQQQVHHEVKSSRGQQERALLPSLPTGAYQSSRKMFCVFNWALEGNDSVRPGYGLAFFPHQLCTDAVLCCAGLEPTTLALQADTIQTLRFSALRLSNAWLRLWLCLGGDEARSRGFADAADDTDARRRLVRSSVDWLQESGFQGVLMHWAPPGPRHPRQLVRILAPFKVHRPLSILAFVVHYTSDQRYISIRSS